MRGILLMGIMIILIPLSFVSPFSGILSFLWLAYSRPQDWAYQSASSYSLVIAIATLLGYAIFEMAKRPPRLVTHFLLVLLWGQLLLSTLLASNSELSRPKFIEFSKIVLISILLTTLTYTATRMRLLLLLTLASSASLAVRGIMAIALSAGTVHIQGPGGQFADNNDYALFLDMTIPLAIFFGAAEKNRWIKLGMYVLALMTAITVLFTYSRGGFLGLCTVSVLMVFKSRHKIIGLSAVLIVGLTLALVLPQGIFDRMSTIRDAHKTDGSAMGRIEAWQVSMRIVADHPFVGVGMRNILNLYGRYNSGQDLGLVAHNSWLQLATDAGLPALFLFISVIGLSYWRLGAARRLMKIRAPDSPLISYTHGMQIALVAFCVSGTFLSRYDLELLYQVFAMSASIMLLARQYDVEAENQQVVEKSLRQSRDLTPATVS
jgi:probable O-glycosylation ligase (exosortase A-associated)